MSEPAKTESEIYITFAPILVSGKSTLSADSGHMESTVTSSESLNAHSNAASSKGFISPFITFKHTNIFIMDHSFKF